MDSVRTAILIFLVTVAFICGFCVFARNWCIIICQVCIPCKSVGDEEELRAEDDENQPLVEIANHEAETSFMRD